MNCGSFQPWLPSLSIQQSNNRVLINTVDYENDNVRIAYAIHDCQEK